MQKEIDMFKICVWSDFTWCDFTDLEEYLSFLSDDFFILDLTFSQYEDLVYNEILIF